MTSDSSFCSADIRVLADDLTGALDTAAAFSGAIPVFIDRPDTEVLAAVGSPVSVVATPTRDVAPQDLTRFLEPCLQWFRSGSLAFKKVDSLLRGNSFAEVAWLLQQGCFEQAIFAPAFPSQGRVTMDSSQWVVDRESVTGARNAVSGVFGEIFLRYGLHSSSFSTPGDVETQVWTPDVVSDADLDTVTDIALRLPGGKKLWCGSAGLAQALARKAGLAPRVVVAQPLPVETGPTILISASHHQVFRSQWDFLRLRGTALAVAENGCSEEINAALMALRQGAENAWFDLSPREKITPQQASDLLTMHTRRLAEELPKPAQLVVVGGDTLLGLCRAAGVKALLAQPSIRNGWGCARLMGGAWNGVPCYSRSGAFGGVDDLTALLGALNQSSYSWKGN